MKKIKGKSTKAVLKKCDSCGYKQKQKAFKQCLQCKGFYGLECCWKNFDSNINNEKLCWGCVELNIEKVLGVDKWTQPNYEVKEDSEALVDNIEKVVAGLINGDFTKTDLLRYFKS